MSRIILTSCIAATTLFAASAPASALGNSVLSNGAPGWGKPAQGAAFSASEKQGNHPSSSRRAISLLDRLAALASSAFSWRLVELPDGFAVDSSAGEDGAAARSNAAGKRKNCRKRRTAGDQPASQPDGADTGADDTAAASPLEPVILFF